MKVNTAVFAIALVLASSVDANLMVRRRPHRDIATHRRSLGSRNFFHNLEDDASSFMNSFRQDAVSSPSSSSSHSTSSSPSSTALMQSSIPTASSSSSVSGAEETSSSSASTPTSHASAPTQSSSSTPSSSSSSSGHSRYDWFRSLFGGNLGNGRSGLSFNFFPFSSSSSGPLASKPKLGLAWPNGDSMNITDFITSKVSWYYTWSPTPGMKNPPSNVTFCPMLWGHKHVNSFRKHVLNNPNAEQNSGKCVMAMNEVNQKGQADMSVGDACSLMREYIMPLKQDHDFYVISPSTTSAPSGKRWMNNFRKECSDVWSKIDAMSVHYYDTNVTAFKEYVQDWHETYNKPIWVTEYACQNFNGGKQCSDLETFIFQKEMSTWFDRQSFVEAYAPFGVMQQMQGVNPNNQMTSNGSPNILFDAIASR